MTEPTASQMLESNTEMPLLPLKDIVVFPHMIVPVFINEDLCINAVEHALAHQRKIFLSAFKVAGEKAEGLDSRLEPPFDVYDFGTVCSVMRTRKLPDGRMKVLVQGLLKAEIKELLAKEPFPAVRIRSIEEPTLVRNSPEVEAMIRATRENLEKVVSLGKVLSPDILMVLEDVTEPGRLSDLVAANLGLKVHEAQSILAVINPVERLKTVHRFLSQKLKSIRCKFEFNRRQKKKLAVCSANIIFANKSVRSKPNLVIVTAKMKLMRCGRKSRK